MLPGGLSLGGTAAALASSVVLSTTAALLRWRPDVRHLPLPAVPRPPDPLLLAWLAGDADPEEADPSAPLNVRAVVVGAAKAVAAAHDGWVLTLAEHRTAGLAHTRHVRARATSLDQRGECPRSECS